MQSPMVYSIASLLLESKKRVRSFEIPEHWRRTCLSNESIISVQDLGSGSREGNSGGSRSVAEIAKYSLSPPFKCKWLYELAQWWQPSHLLELGTSLGVSTLYLSMASPKAHLVTLEGSPAQAALAKDAFEQYASSPILCKVGAFHEVLPTLVGQPWEMVFVDGHHDGEATLAYWDWVVQNSGSRCLMVFDDIYWSPSMTEAWLKIQERSSLSLDFYHFGVVIQDSKIMRKQHFSLVPYQWKPWQIGLFV